MLALTSEATDAIASILSDADAPVGAGIRIEYADTTQSANGERAEGSAIRLLIRAAALGGDQIIEDEGARVFLEPGVSRFLDDKVLDVAIDGDGVEFVLAQQG